MKLGSIQFLRAIAVILFVYFYSIDLTAGFGKSQQYNFYYLKEMGVIGIDLFCVISGFVVFYTARSLSGASEGWHFLKKRFFRINPLFYLCSVVFFATQFLLMWAVNSPNIFLLTTKIASGLVDTLWIVPTSKYLLQYKLYLAIGWSLGFAWLFSILFYLTILTRVRMKVLVLTGMIVLLVAAGYFLKPKDIRLGFATNAMLLEFLFGTILGQLYLRFSKIPAAVSILLLLIGIGGFISPVFYNYGDTGNASNTINGTVSLQRALLWGLPSGCLMAGCLFLERDDKLKAIWNNRLFRLIGDASYSIFLTHATLFTLLTIVYHKVNYLLLPDLSILLQFVLALGFGIAFYRWVEKPYFKWGSRAARQSTSLNISEPQPQPQST